MAGWTAVPSLALGLWLGASVPGAFDEADGVGHHGRRMRIASAPDRLANQGVAMAGLEAPEAGCRPSCGRNPQHVSPLQRARSGS